MSNGLSRIERLISHIESNLDAQLDLEALSTEIHVSKYHLHRQCSAYLGMTIIQLVRLLRFKRATYQLAFRSELKITDIALGAGFESHEAFSRAFKQQFLTSPTAFRENPDWLAWQAKYDPVIKIRNKTMVVKNGMSALPTVELVTFEETKIAVLEHKGAPYLLGKSIQSFISWRKGNALPPSKSRTFNLVYDDPCITPPDEYRFDLCCEVERQVEENEQGVINKIIPQGVCARIRHIGSDDTLGQLVDYLYSSWLEGSNYQLRDFPVFFERVSFFPEVAESEMITDVYLPISE